MYERLKDKKMEWYWKVTRDGVEPIELNPEDLKKCDTWLLSHEYNGMIIFENYSRAMLCWYEKKRQNAWGIVQ